MKLKCPMKASWTVLFFKLEALIAILFSLYFFHYVEGSWLLFVCLFFLADISLVGYLFGTKVGSIFYNMAHTTVGPMILGGYGFLQTNTFLISIALIWACHIFFDRLLGIDLKSSKGFKNLSKDKEALNKLKKN